MLANIVDYALILLDGNGRIMSWNAGAQRIKGFTAEEIVGRPFSCFYTPEDVARKEPERALAVALAEGHCASMGWRLRKDGSRFWADTVITALRGKDGSFHGFSKIVRDVTRKKMEEDRFRLVVEAAPNAMVMVGKDGSIVLVNSQTERLFGYPREELIGQLIEILVPVRFRANHPGLRGGFFAGPQARPMGAGRDLFGLRKDGSEIPVEIGLNPIETDEGTFVLAAIIDITERKKAEHAAKIEAAGKEMESFNYAVAHDLRAPLRKIFGFNDLLTRRLGGKLDAESRACLAKVQDSVTLMDEIIEGLLKLSRILQQEPKREAVDLSRLAAEIAAELSHAQPHRRVEFVVAPRVTVQGDPEFFGIVMRNLLENAWKFTAKHDRARIEFGVTAQAGERVFFVRDDGAGFDMAYSDKLFGAFKRLHAAQTFPGTGIGLATVRRVINRCGGRIWAEAAVERGATFFFTLGAVS